MDEVNNIRIKKMVIHILDQDAKIPILSEEEHPLDNGEIVDFFEGHIIKILKDSNLKKAEFGSGDNVIKTICEELYEDTTEFIELSKQIATNMYDIMLKNNSIPSADLACILFELDKEPFLGIFKMNYRTSFIHFVESSNGDTLNTIIKQRTTLPGESQKVDECALINLFNLHISLIEKKYDIDGEKINYFSNTFLVCKSGSSDKEKIKTFNKANQVFKKTYFDNDVTKLGDIKNAVKESIEEKGVIDIVEVADNAFKDSPEMKNVYVDHIKGCGFTSESIEIAPELGDKEFRKQKIKTDTGVEINLPTDYYKDKDMIEFLNNPDGTISIVIKNITKIIDR